MSEMIYPICFLNILLFCRMVVYYYQRGKDKIPPRKKGKSLNTRKVKNMEAYERIYKAETDGGEIIARADTLTTIDIALRYALESAKNRGDNYHYEQFKTMAEQIYNILDADGYFDK